MISYNIEITEPAENDLYSIGTYISKELLQPETARKIVSEIAKKINTLENMRLRNGLVSNDRLAYQGIRKILI